MELDITTVTTALCRVCMIAEAEHFTNLHETFSCGQPSLYEMLEAICAPVFRKSDVDEIVPGLPTAVCPPCRNAIVAAYNLHQQCIETDRRLSELLALKWELQGPGGEEDIGDSDHVKTMKEEPIPEILKANVENEVDYSKQDEVSDIGEASSSSRIEEPILEEAFNEDSNQHGQRNKSVTIKSNGQKKKSNNESRKGNISCPVCEKVFSYRDSLNRHINENYCDGTNDPKKRTCDICKKVLKSVRLMEVHRQMHSPKSTPAETQQRAPEADKLLHLGNSEQDWKMVEPISETENTKGSDNEVLPEERNQAKEDVMNVSIDGQQSSAADSKPLPCDICGKAFSSTKSLYYHKHNHRYHNICKECGKMFISNGALQEHIAKGNCLGDLARTCKLCNIIFDTLYLYKAHCKESHSGPVVCPDCGRTLANYIVYHQHIKRNNCIKN